MTVLLKPDTLLLKHHPLLRPSRNGTTNTIDDTMAGIDSRSTAKHMTNQTGMTGRVNQIGYLTITHNTTLGNCRDHTVNGITEN